MTQDARESLTALAVVSAVILFFVAAMQLFKYVDVPDWLLRTLQAAVVLGGLIRLAKWLWERRQSRPRADRA